MNRLSAQKTKLRKKTKLAADIYANYLTKAQYLTDLRIGFCWYFGLIVVGIAAMFIWPEQVAARLLPVLNHAEASTANVRYLLWAVWGFLGAMLVFLTFPRRLKVVLTPAQALFRAFLKMGLAMCQALSIWGGVALVVLVYSAFQDGAVVQWYGLKVYGGCAVLAQLFVVTLEFALVNQYVEKYLAGRVLPEKSV